MGNTKKEGKIAQRMKIATKHLLQKNVLQTEIIRFELLVVSRHFYETPMNVFNRVKRAFEEEGITFGTMKDADVHMEVGNVSSAGEFVDIKDRPFNQILNFFFPSIVVARIVENVSRGVKPYVIVISQS